MACEKKKYLTKSPLAIIFTPRAEVAELVDALGSGSSGRMLVGVRLSPSAPVKKLRAYSIFTVSPFFGFYIVREGLAKELHLYYS